MSNYNEIPIYLITYQNKNLELKHRYLKNYNYSLKVGDTTSMGWYVLDIQTLYNGRFYTNKEYSKICSNSKKGFLWKIKKIFHKKY